ncbi:hypothetical protein AVEN_242322-1 [Araneus ventricosus]|uniref:Uncharacterized protein n=1 Tax=Araneus ventricosus TaxID=182803 RepID=A0A4Y2IEK0_ARAVE|nr:hypothetical protein AVEN_242322-1 [Araneus ventricosus]
MIRCGLFCSTFWADLKTLIELSEKVKLLICPLRKREPGYTECTRYFHVTSRPVRKTTNTAVAERLGTCRSTGIVFGLRKPLESLFGVLFALRVIRESQTSDMPTKEASKSCLVAFAAVN